jgi:Fe-S cluster assembly protein SufD
VARRRRAFARFSELRLPTESEEIWRYSPIDQLELDDYRPVPEAVDGRQGRATDDGLVPGDVGLFARALTTWEGRWDGAAAPVPPGVTLAPVSEANDGDVLLGDIDADDSLAALHDAFLPDALLVDVADGVVAEDPIVVLHRCATAAGFDAVAGGHGSGAPGVFPHLVVRLGKGAQLSLIEVVTGASGDRPALVMPVTQATVADGARLSYVSLQMLGHRAWHIGRLAADVGADATLRSFSAGLGSAYDRLRTDVTVSGRGGTSELRSIYLGTGEQVHDLRTLQDHAAPSTISDLLCTGAVTGSARSIYSGLIRVRPGAVRTDAMQTNHNLVLGPHAHADSVPNLEIEENDVRCSHASTVGPVDTDQLYYLGSRGIPPERAERLIVMGYFADVVDRCPVPSATGLLRREVASRLARGLADDAAAQAVGQTGGGGG